MEGGGGESLGKSYIRLVRYIFKFVRKCMGVGEVGWGNGCCEEWMVRN